MFLSMNSGKSIDVHPSWYVVSETTTVMTQLYVGKTLVFCRFVQNRISQNPLVNISQSGHTWGYPPFSDSKLPAPNQMLPSPWIAGVFFPRSGSSEGMKQNTPVPKCQQFYTILPALLLKPYPQFEFWMLQARHMGMNPNWADGPA